MTSWKVLVSCWNSALGTNDHRYILEVVLADLSSQIIFARCDQYRSYNSSNSFFSLKYLLPWRVGYCSYFENTWKSSSILSDGSFRINLVAVLFPLPVKPRKITTFSIELPSSFVAMYPSFWKSHKIKFQNI